MEKMLKLLSIAALVFVSSSCSLPNLDAARSKKYIDSIYFSSESTKTTATCLKRGWEKTKTYASWGVSVDEYKINNGYVLYTQYFYEVLDIYPFNSGSKIVYYHNGSESVNTKELLINEINKCVK